MSLLSTLRPLPQRLLERLWLILSGYVPIAIEYHMTMNALNDDCLLILLDTLTMSQLLQLRGVSRRLCQLIERHSLRKFKTLIWNYDEMLYKEKTGERTTRLHFVSRKDPFQNFGLRYIFMQLQETPKLSTSLPIPLRTRAWPLSLPCLLPDLLSFTLEYFLVDQVDAQTEEHLAVNRRFAPYLNSNWSRTLTTLHLYIHVPSKPRNVQPDNASFAQLNQLINLKHLFIYFTIFREFVLLPDSMPIFSQLLGFALHNYAASNVATLLHQLGPDLSLLSLRNVNCSEDDLVAFLRARPNYARTLKTFDVPWKDMSWKIFTATTQNLSSLVEFNHSPHYVAMTELESIFTELSHLPHLQYIRYVPLFVSQLRALLLRQHMPGALPRLTSIRQANIDIYHLEEGPFQPSELFNELLPLVFAVFCSLEKLSIYFCQERGRRHEEFLSVKLYTKVFQLAPSLQRLTAFYYI